MKKLKRSLEPLLLLTVLCLLLYSWQVVLQYLGVYPYIKAFVAGFVVAGFTLPLVAYYMYKMHLESPPGKPFKCIQPGKELSDLIHSPKHPLIDQILIDKDKEPGTWGHVTIQMQGKRKERQEYFCVLKGETLFYQVHKEDVEKSINNKEGKAKKEKFLPEDVDKIQAMVLTGAYIKFLAEGEMKGAKFAIMVIHPQRCLLYKMDYVFLILPDRKTWRNWYNALRTVCIPLSEIYGNPKLSDGHLGIENFRNEMQMLHAQKKFETPEEAVFLNAILARVFVHVTESPDIKAAIVEWISKKMAIAIEKENIQGWLSDIVITDVNLGNKPPRLTDFRVVSPLKPNDPNTDLDVRLSLSLIKTGLKLGVSTKVVLKKTVHIDIKGAIEIEELKGILQISMWPYPMSRMAISFVKPPEVLVDIQVAIGNSSAGLESRLPGLVKRVLSAKLKEAINDGLVYPNAEWVKMPGTPENEPPSPRTSTHISSKYVVDHDSDEDDISNTEGSQPDTIQLPLSHTQVMQPPADIGVTDYPPLSNSGPASITAGRTTGINSVGPPNLISTTDASLHGGIGGIGGLGFAGFASGVADNGAQSTSSSKRKKKEQDNAKQAALMRASSPTILQKDGLDVSYEDLAAELNRLEILDRDDETDTKNNSKNSLSTSGNISLEPEEAPIQVDEPVSQKKKIRHGFPLPGSGGTMIGNFIPGNNSQKSEKSFIKKMTHHITHPNKEILGLSKVDFKKSDILDKAQKNSPARKGRKKEDSSDEELFLDPSSSE